MVQSRVSDDGIVTVRLPFSWDGQVTGGGIAPGALEGILGGEPLLGVVVLGGTARPAPAAPPGPPDVDALRRILALAPVPVLAAVEGSCRGAGLVLAMACPLVGAAPGARFVVPADVADLPVFRRLCRSLEVAPAVGWDGPALAADEALHRRLADFLLCGDPAAAARQILGRMVQRRSSALVRQAMAAVRDGSCLPVAEALAAETRRFMALARSHDR